MIKKSKRAADVADTTDLSPKKSKKISQDADNKPNLKVKKSKKEGKTHVQHDKKFTKNDKFTKSDKPSFHSKSTDAPDKTDWTKFKIEKKELKIKRKQARGMFDVIVEAKKIGEVLRQKHLKGGSDERNKLVAKLHGMLAGKEQYGKLVLSHDMARIVQYLLKFGPESTRKDITEELIPIALQMLQSTYGRYCFKNMLKYGNAHIRTSTINKLYGHAVKITSSVVSAAIFEYAYTTWASPQQKQHLIQEFFGDMYKQAKDDKVKHLRDVYKDSAGMKAAALNATKANLAKILNKDLLDSGLVQSVLHQYLTECNVEDRTELIGQLAPHAVIISNSKDGARAAMHCIWHGTNKDRKLAMKAIKEHVLDLSKHEHGHCTIITLFDTADDTVLLNKMIIGHILTDIENLAKDEWGRRVLLWMVAPADSTHFHPVFIKELEAGRESSTCKKEPEARRKELLQYCSSSLAKSVAAKPEFWLSTASIAVVAVAILKSSTNEDGQEALQSIAKQIIDPDWKIKDEKEIQGIEHPGIHMLLKKLAQHDKVAAAANAPTFGKELLDIITDQTILSWLPLNRGCFLLVSVYENGTEEVQELMKEKLKVHLKTLKKQNGAGAKILVKKLCSN